MPHDYYSRQEFWDFVKDDAAPHTYSPAQVDRAQEEIIERLESWARSAFPNIPQVGVCSVALNDVNVVVGSGSAPVPQDVGRVVRIAGAGTAGADLLTTVTGTGPGTFTIGLPALTAVAAVPFYLDGDGRGATLRHAKETFDGGEDTYALGAVPIFNCVVSWLGDVMSSVNDYILRADLGIIQFPSILFNSHAALTVEYDYGYSRTPWSIKRPCMLAARSLLDMEQDTGGSKIPPNVVAYSSEGVSFTFARGGEASMPFPWDSVASDAVVGYWEPQRPTFFQAV